MDMAFDQWISMNVAIRFDVISGYQVRKRIDYVQTAFVKQFASRHFFFMV